MSTTTTTRVQRSRKVADALSQDLDCGQRQVPDRKRPRRQSGPERREEPRVGASGGRDGSGSGGSGCILPQTSHLHYFGSKGAYRRKPLRAAMEGALSEATALYSPFFGAGAFEYFAKSLFPELRVVGFEIIPEIANFHKVFAREPQALLREAERLLAPGPLTRDIWDGYRATLASGAGTDVERAALTFVISRSSFAGKLRTFASKATAHNRHATVVPSRAWRYGPIPDFDVRCEDGLRWLETEGPRLPRGTVLFVDPPYYLTRNHYGIFEKQPLFDHARLCAALRGVPAHVRWFLCYNDAPEVHALYSGSFATVDRVPFTYRKLDRSDTTEELLIYST